MEHVMSVTLNGERKKTGRSNILYTHYSATRLCLHCSSCRGGIELSQQLKSAPALPRPSEVDQADVEASDERSVERGCCGLEAPCASLWTLRGLCAWTRVCEE